MNARRIVLIISGTVVVCAALVGVFIAGLSAGHEKDAIHALEKEVAGAEAATEDAESATEDAESKTSEVEATAASELKNGEIEVLDEVYFYARPKQKHALNEADGWIGINTATADEYFGEEIGKSNAYSHILEYTNQLEELIEETGPLDGHVVASLREESGEEI